MDEPVGRTIDGTPWDEARGPHLPDPLTRIPAKLPRTSWAFVILAVATGLILVTDRFVPFWPDVEEVIGSYLRSLVGLILVLIPPIVTILFGAALFARHRQAWTTHRALAVGVAMLAVVEAMQSVSRWVIEFFVLVAPPDDSIILTPGYIAYSVMTTILLVLGFLYVARGASVARLRPDRVGRGRLLVATFAALLLAGSSILADLIVANVTSFNGSSTDDLGNTYFIYSVLSLIVRSLLIAAQAYLAVVLWAGMAADERPTRAWRLATAGVWLILLASGTASLGTASVVVAASDEVGMTVWSWLGLIWTSVSALGYVLLLAGFVRGFPSDPDGDRPATVG